MKNVFFIVGPTAVGKSEVAAEVARICDGEVVSADAFQIYAGLSLLTAKPDNTTIAKVPHHLIGTVPLSEPMNAERFRVAANSAIEGTHARGKCAFVVGGSGMYVQALTNGLSPLPEADRGLRREFEQRTTAELLALLREKDPETAARIHAKNRHRIVRVLEICLLTGLRTSELRRRIPPAQEPAGVLLFRERAELYDRINERVLRMFEHGAVDEVRAVGETSATAAKALGLSHIRELLAGGISDAECVAQIQQASRRYAKRQLTWFQRQTNFEPLNLSLHGSSEAIEMIARKARLSFVQNG
ncbi:MAG: tRNA (adenosine(37)-N6)-dimethylallyltransferase MiaA [Chthoniobacterales bacterium]|nr:tRNA (adenosine(37)-N6)-dimethylallyltransferase MiaA [Chthoniobacterales bacterium]